jgi:hypothetical protein
MSGHSVTSAPFEIHGASFWLIGARKTRLVAALRELSLRDAME